MARFTSLCVLAVLAFGVAASPLVTIKESRTTLPFSTRLNLTSGMKLADFDRARAKELVRRAKRTDKAAVVNVPVTNAAVRTLTYYSDANIN